MSIQQEKFIELLKEIFQFDQADLDFGIYRIMNQKREEINGFLKNELAPQVQEAFEKYKDSDIEEVKQEIENLEKQLSDMGVTKEDSEKYQTLNEKLFQSIDISSLENEVFSDLTNFFRRYYYEGDFLSLRRYKNDVYAIPYEGEEVKLHWANTDQYYVKTSEYFMNYSFNLPSGKTVHFKLVEASTEENNNKEQENKERRFMLYEKEPINEINEELYIYFEYKAPEKKQNQQKFNESIKKQVFASNKYNEWINELKILSPTEKNKKRTLFEKYLIDYTARNTFDYFIHKDLGGFLRRELDFFIKNEIMHLDDLDTEHEKRFEQYLSKIKVIKSIGHKIIAFVEQIEVFQKKLWLKKKFVLDSQYCITLDRLPEKFYSKITSNSNQLEEWKDLFAIDELNNFTEPLTIDFLRENKYLVLDTIHFTEGFRDEVISSFENLEEELGGLLIHSENFQGLNLLNTKYKEKIKTIYIDPPYNTGDSEILYKNNYKHSSWLSLMSDRIRLSKEMLKNEGVYVVAIDDEEQLRLGMLLENIFPNHNQTAVTVVSNPSGQQGNNFSYTHEYAYFVYPSSPGKHIGLQNREEDADVRPLRDVSKGNHLREDAKNCFYPIYIKNEKIIGFGDVSNDSFHPESTNVKREDGIIEVYPIDAKGNERKWVFSRQRVESIKKELSVEYNKSRKIWDIIRTKKAFNFKTVWTDKKYSANSYGSKLLNNIMGSQKFSYPKSINTVMDCIQAATNNQKDELILDFFAGSGTTGQAVIDLNRNDNGNRKYILIEMGDYFNTVTKPRLQKIMYSKDWKDGKPISREGTSHMFKYIELESYEDTLNNIKLQRTVEQEETLEGVMSPATREEYWLSYMLDVESESSPSLLNINLFNNPFEYKMLIQEGMEIKKRKIDLVETFNYLIGLHVQKIDVIEGIKVVTGTLRTDEKVLILWRNIDEISNEKLEDFFKEQEYNTKDKEFDRIYVNGDNHLENLKMDDEQWKVVLIEKEFKHLMFDTHDV